MIKNKLTLIFCLLSFSSFGNIEFFFNTSPANLNKNFMGMVHNIPISAIGHGSFYISSACFDLETYQVRLCDERDEEKGVVISFDVEMQKKIGRYFIGVTPKEYFFGGKDNYKLPKVITDDFIDEIDNNFFDKYELLKGSSVLEDDIQGIHKKYSIDKQVLLNIIRELDTIPYTYENFLEICQKHHLKKLSNYQLKNIFEKIKYLDKRGSKVRGLSRREVSLANSFYEGLWSLVYPSTLEEEKNVIDYINTMPYKKADLTRNNCVYPLNKIGKMLFDYNLTFPPYLKIPYWVFGNIVKNTIEKNVGEKNQFGNEINRPGIYIKYYPMLELKFDKHVDKTPQRHFDNPYLLGYYGKYEGEYTNHVDWMIKKLIKKDKKQFKDQIKKLKKIKAKIYELEKELNNLKIKQIQEANGLTDHFTQKMESLEEKIQDKFNKTQEYFL